MQLKLEASSPKVSYEVMFLMCHFPSFQHCSLGPPSPNCGFYFPGCLWCSAINPLSSGVRYTDLQTKRVIQRHFAVMNSKLCKFLDDTQFWNQNRLERAINTIWHKCFILFFSSLRQLANWFFLAAGNTSMCIKGFIVWIDLTWCIVVFFFILF